MKALTFKSLFLEENNSFDLIIILSELNFRDKIEIGSVDNFKIFLKIGTFFSINKLESKDITFKKADFNIEFDDLFTVEAALFDPRLY